MSKQALKRVRRHLKMEVNRTPLDAYAWPGGYPLFYPCRDGGVLCPACANREVALIDAAVRDGTDRQWDVYGVDVNWDNDDLCCDHCSQPIPSAYGEPECTSSPSA